MGRWIVDLKPHGRLELTFIIALTAAAALVLGVVFVARVPSLHAGRTHLPSAEPVKAATPAPLSLSHYESTDYPYDFSYPEGWTAVTTSPENVVFHGPAGRQIQIAVRNVPASKPPTTLPAYVDKQVEALRAQLSNPVELQRNRVGLPNGQIGVEVDLSWTEAGAARRTLLLYVLDADIAFVLRADAPASAFPAERRLLETSLRSFSLIPSD